MSVTAQEFESKSQLLGSRGKTWAEVSDTLRPPYRWICQIHHDGVPAGTGVLIGPFHVLTAAHVVERVPSTVSIYVKPAAMFGKSPFGTHRVKRPIERNRYRGRGSAFDYTVLHLERDIRQRKDPNGRPLSFWGGNSTSRVKRVDPLWLERQRICTSGYPGRLGGRDGGNQYRSQGRLWVMHREVTGAVRKELAPLQRRFFHSLATTRGQSGSPMWVRHDGAFNLVGLATTATRGKHNWGLRVTREFIRELRRMRSPTR